MNFFYPAFLAATLFFNFFCPALFSEEYPPDIEKILKSKTLVIGMVNKKGFPFFMKNKEGNWIGNDLEMAQEIAKYFGVKLVINRESNTFDDVIELVNQKKVDMAISELSETLPRLKKVAFTQPYIVLHNGLLLNRILCAKITGSQKSIVEKLNNPNVKIGYLGNSSWELFTEETFPIAQKVAYPDFGAVIQATYKQEITAGFVEELVVRTLPIFYPELTLEIETAIINDLEDRICIALPSDSYQLLRWTNAYINTKKGELSLNKLIERYGEYLKNEK